MIFQNKISCVIDLCNNRNTINHTKTNVKLCDDSWSIILWQPFSDFL